MPLVDLRRTADWERWRALAKGAPPFLAPEFFALAAPLAGGDAVVAEAWGDHALRGALPLRRDGDTLHALRCDHSPDFELAGDPGALDAIWRALGRDRGWDRIVLEKVREESPLATTLPAIARADGCPTVVRPDGRHLYLALPGFEATISGRFRQNLARCARKAGGVALERIVAPTRGELDAALALEAMAWKGAAGTAITADERATHLYRALLRWGGRRGTASLSFLRAGERRIAMLIAVEDEHTLYALKIGYDPAFAPISPGHLMIWKAAADAEARGLQELDFVGRDDEWKRKWTDTAHAHVTVTIYRRSARGLARYWYRERLRPRLPESLRSPLPRHCQRADRLGDHALWTRARLRVEAGLGLRPAVRRALRRLSGAPPIAPMRGAESAFPVGAWVRVLDEPRLRATLDAHDKLRGLAFVPAQAWTCGKVFKVASHVRRLRDDHGVFRPVSRTVLLAGVDCSGDGTAAAPQGCGRHCPLLFRDEWLEPAADPRLATPPATHARRHARIKDADEIARHLDPFGRQDGLTFMPEMAAHAGKRLAIVAELDQVFEDDRWMAPRKKIFLLEGLACTGAITGARGPCDRRCALLWHEDWLIVEPEVVP